MRIRKHTKIPAMPLRHKAEYEYHLPQDEDKVIIDACTHAGLKAIDDFPTMKLTKAEIETRAEQHCYRMKPSKDYAKLTNDINRFIALFTAYYAETYLRNIVGYQNDYELHQRWKKRIDDRGQEGYLYMRNLIAADFKAVMKERR